MQDLKVTLFQSDLYWESRDKNLEHFSRLFDKTGPADIYVLPEMFNSGFTMEPGNVAEHKNGKTIDWMRQEANKNNVSICGSLVIKEDEKYYNRMIYCFSDGTVQHYDKRFLFGLAGEDEAYKPGHSQAIVEEKGWKIMLQVCYDMRFPQAFSNYYVNQEPRYDVLLNVANWPGKRALHWKTLLQARAIENQSYAVGLNRVGKDPKDLEYTGDSRIIDPLGEIVLQTEAGKEKVLEKTLSSEKLKEIRQKLPFLRDAF